MDQSTRNGFFDHRKRANGTNFAININYIDDPFIPTTHKGKCIFLGVSVWCTYIESVECKTIDKLQRKWSLSFSIIFSNQHLLLLVFFSNRFLCRISIKIALLSILDHHGNVQSNISLTHSTYVCVCVYVLLRHRQKLNRISNGSMFDIQQHQQQQRRRRRQYQRRQQKNIEIVWKKVNVEMWNDKPKVTSK